MLVTNRTGFAMTTTTSTAITGLFTSDASLVRCELDRVRDLITLPGEYAAVGGWHDNMVVQRRYGAGGAREEVWEVPDTDVVMLASGTLPVGAQLELSGQPFRFHDWLFSEAGTVGRTAHVRDRLFEQLPEFLQNTVRGSTFGEVVFAHFLAALRSLGRIDDPALDATIAARLLQVVASSVEQAASEAGANTKSQLALIASNGRVLVAARRGAQQLSYILLEGQVGCRRCEIAPNAPEKDALVRDHRRRHSVVVSTLGLGPRDVVVPDGSALAISGRVPGEHGHLSVKVISG
jgi:glutamine amidotransferase